MAVCRLFLRYLHWFHIFRTQQVNLSACVHCLVFCILFFFRVLRRHSLLVALRLSQTLSVMARRLRQAAYLLSACSAALLLNTEAATYSGGKKGKKSPVTTFPDNRHSFSPAVGQFYPHPFLN